MKKNNQILIISIVLTFTVCIYSQFDLPKKLKKKADKELNKASDDAIDKTFETIKKGDTAEDSNTKQTNSDVQKKNEKVTKSDSSIDQQNEEKQEELKLWSKYDFVAGDKIIFEDNLAGEEGGEFPSRWDLISGSAEVASLGDENVIHFSNNNSIIFSLMDKKDFLPEIFTIEFDVFFEDGGAKWSDIYKIRFFEGTGNTVKIEGKYVLAIDIRWNEVKMGQFGGKTKSYVDEKKNWQPKWKHIAIAFNKRSLKLYMNEERMLNIPNLGFQPKMFSIGGHYDDRNIKMSSIKNIRVNEGGKKLYDRIMEEGKFVTRGILFEVNKSSIKGESMGTINEIVEMMKEHPDLKFRVEGHTDSDGEDTFNQKLSEVRSVAVKSVLTELGVNGSRLETKGFGENKPVSDNTTSEGKANNRRVEFIKI